MLEEARRQLISLLESPNLLWFVEKNPDLIVGVLDNWFEALKLAEGDDVDFIKIWREHRMFVRSIGASDTVYDTLEAKTPTYEAFKEQGWKSAKGEGVSTSKFKGVKYDTGKDGIQKRMNPANFLDERKAGVVKNKYAEGLMDVSGTVMRNDRAIGEQLHNKPMRGDWVCFLPLSDEKDQELILFVKDKLSQLQLVLGKGHPQLNLVINKFKRIRAEVTCIKLAFETDMALGFVAVPNADGTYTKFTYMVKSEVKYSMRNQDPALANKKVGVSNELVALLRNNVKRYKSCVGIAIKNEMRVAMRKHACDLWPMFARWDGPDNSTAGTWEVCKKVGGQWAGTGRRIPSTL